MQEITRIHLATTPYNIELSAKKSIEAYLDAVKHALHADEDAMREIESRMSELLSGRGIKPEGVVTLADVEAIEEQLGEPGVFAEEAAGADDQPKPEQSKPVSKRRLMRDPQNAMIGGVCSGLAAFLGLDTVWVRLAFGILLIITSGAIIPVYILMWIIMPEAKTASDRLEMSGSPITLESLKVESVVGNTKSTNEPFLVRLIRYLTGFTFTAGAIAAIAATIAVVSLVIANRHDYFIQQNMNWLPLPLGLMAFAGVLLTILLGLVAYICFRRAVSRTIVIALIITTFIGLVSFASGAALTSSKASTFQNRVATANQTTVLNTNGSFDGSIQEVNLMVGGNVSVRYDVTSDQPSITASYNPDLTTKPALRFHRSANTLSVEGDVRTGDRCKLTMFFACNEGMVIVMHGPALQALMATNGSVTYTTTTQPQLALKAMGNSSVTIESSGTIDMLDAALHGDSVLSTTNATLVASNLTIDGRSQAEFGKLDSLAVTANTTCNEMNGRSETSVMVEAIQTSAITVNGASWNKSANSTCVTINDPQQFGRY